MPQKTTTYDILISCPSDVAPYVEYIKRAVNSFNNGYGKNCNISLRTRYWKDDGFSESGGMPQDLLNKQLVDDADMGVAVFWTRFGTKTQNYGSGSEEEIEKMISDKKQMFIYFMGKAVELSEINTREIEKINRFKEKYKDRGVYYDVNNEVELEQKFRDHLERYFGRYVKKKSK